MLNSKEEEISYAKNPSRPAQNVSADEFAWQTVKQETGREDRLIIQKKKKKITYKKKNRKASIHALI
jgi:hypothetical protein